MNLTQEKALFHLAGKPDFTQLGSEALQHFADDHPYFAPAQYFLASKLKLDGNASAAPQTVKTNFYFTNPLWLQFQLQHGLKNSVSDTVAPSPARETNTIPADFAIPTVEAVKEIMRKIDLSQETTSDLDIDVDETDANSEIGADNKIAGLLSSQLADFKKPVEAGAKLDNLLQIAHNVEIGNNTVIAAQAGISGSTKIGNNVMIGGQVGIVGHLQIADGSKINAQSGVSKSIKKANTAVTGSPAYDYTAALRSQAMVRSLPEMEKRIQQLEKMVNELLMLNTKKV